MLRYVWLLILLSSQAMVSQAMELTGNGEYLANRYVSPEDAFQFARNRAIADASEQASILVESNYTLVKTQNQQWARQEIRQLSASLLHISNITKRQETTPQGILYRVNITADFDEAQQYTLQTYLSDNQELRKQLQGLAIAQTKLQQSIEQTQQEKRDADASQRAIMQSEQPQTLISRYEQTLNDTKTWVSEQQRRHLDIALQTVEMRQIIERNQKALAQERQRIAEQKEAIQKEAAEKKAQQIANMRYISAQHIRRFVMEHMPLTTDALNIQPTQDESVTIQYRLQWQMSPNELERLCQLFYDGNLADSCHITDNNKRVDVKFKADLFGGLFQPLTEHKQVWKNPQLNLYVAHDNPPLPDIFVLDKPNKMIHIQVAGNYPMTFHTRTSLAREKMAGGQDLLGGKWQ